MNKKEVAEKLGITVRRVEILAKQGRFGEVSYIHTKHGRTADYEAEAVEKLIAERATPDTAILTMPNTLDVQLFAGAFVEAVKMLKSAKEFPDFTTNEQPKREPVRIAEKLMLSIDECRVLSGLPESFIRKAIKANELKAQKIGRGLKVSRKTLDKWISLVETKLE